MSVLSVSQFVTAVSAYLERGLGMVQVQGEVMDYRLSHDKFVWFELKDASSRVKCFGMKWEVPQMLEDGMDVVITGLPKLFQRSGGFHIRVQGVELRGEGALRRAFELTKKKLESEGVFDDQYKKPLPRFPERIGLITSSEAAAYTDVLRILGNRWGGLELFLASVNVQGASAIAQIVNAIEYYNREHPVDVLLLTRGGGSLEDLQAFNSEKVARAVFASRIPVVVAVGHERDESLADFAADVRASTPSNAAEIMVPDRQDIVYQLGQMEGALVRGVEDELAEHVRLVDDSISRLGRVVDAVFVRFRELEQRIRHALRFFDGRRQLFLEKWAYLHVGLKNRCSAWIGGLQDKMETTSSLLRSFDPEATLNRGYSITFHEGKVLSSSQGVSKGATLTSRLKDGEISSTVNSG